MDIYLKEISDKSYLFRFPSLPEDSLTIQGETAYQTYNLISMGNMQYPKGTSKSQVKWNATFWGEDRADMSGINREWRDPWECVQKLDEWRQEGTPLTLIISGGGVDMDVTIASFQYQPVGGHGDVKYSIVLNAYNQTRVYTTTETGVTEQRKKKTNRNSASVKVTYTIKSGDTLAKISKKQYGTTSKWKDILSKNKSVLDKAAKKHGHKGCSNGKYLYAGTKITLP
jgi:nucleoid-associated protein YgaU